MSSPFHRIYGAVRHVFQVCYQIARQDGMFRTEQRVVVVGGLRDVAGNRKLLYPIITTGATAGIAYKFPEIRPNVR